ncbi:hypothetical protein ACG3RN_22945 [Pseudomonas aeruginosa]
MPLKIVWALLDLVSIVILASGLYLWLGRRKTPLEQKRLAELPGRQPGDGGQGMRRGLGMILAGPCCWPLLGLFGLLSALLGDGLYDLLSWLALGTPLVLVGWVWLRLP